MEVFLLLILIFLVIWLLHTKSNSRNNTLDEINNRYLEVEKKYEPQRQQRINEYIEKTLAQAQQGNNVDKVN